MMGFSPAAAALGFAAVRPGAGETDEERRRKLLMQQQQRLLPGLSPAGAALGMAF